MLEVVLSRVLANCVSRKRCITCAQVAFADRLLINKTDLVSEADLVRVEGRLRSINKFAPTQRCCRSEVSVDSVLDIHGFDLNRTLEFDPEFLNTENEHEHDSSVSSVSISLPGDVDMDLVQAWVSKMLETKGADIFRMKGVLSIAHAEKRFVYQAVHMIFNGTFDEPWGKDEVRESKVRGLTPNPVVSNPAPQGSKIARRLTGC